MGGIPIFFGAVFALIIWLPAEHFIDVRYLFMSLSLIFLTGLRDDLVPLPASIKLAGQIIPACIIIYWGNVELTSLYGFGSDTLFPGIVTWLLTLFTIVVLTNSFNLIDGLDGLAGTISLIILLSFGIWFYLLGNNVISAISFAAIGSLVAFLLFNWQPSRIFMGDTGALLLGFLLTCLAIVFINTNYYLAPDDPLKFTSSVATCLAVMIIPILDTIRIFIIRLSQGRSPFQADKKHLHHELIRLGMSHQGAVLTLGGINLLFIAMALIFRNFSDIIIFPILLCMVILVLTAIKAASIRENKRNQILKPQTQKARIQ
jgi:UDP-N-acetylmuramyl pentapeptide phosphotransferase/UDP-N-acetylglucosamine-1-phosphate transferase